jgi:RNA polymerase sigma-70 factor, ECF subfamily
LLKKSRDRKSNRFVASNNWHEPVPTSAMRQTVDQHMSEQPPNRDVDPSDAELVSRITSRDEAAMAAVYARYGSAVFSLAHRVLTDRGLAEDITQEVFLQLWNNAEQFDADRGKLRTFLLTRTHGRCVDVIRSRNARAAREDRVSDDRSASVPDPLDAELTALTEAELVREAIDNLPPEERTVLHLAYFGANTYREVARILELPEGTVKTRMRSALKRLRVDLHDHFFGSAGETTMTAMTASTDPTRNTSKQAQAQS